MNKFVQYSIDRSKYLKKDYINKSLYIENNPYQPVTELTVDNFIMDIFGTDEQLPFQTSTNVTSTDYKYNALLSHIPLSSFNKQQLEYKGLSLSKRTTFNRIIYSDYGNLTKYISGREVIIAPVTFAGKRRLSKNARQFYSFVVDLDGVETFHLSNLFSYIEDKELPWPNIIVNSGTGVHLYYNLEFPIDCWKAEQQLVIRNILHKLNKLFWIEDYTTYKKESVSSKLSAIQGYRTIGCLTKKGQIVKGYKFDEVSKYTLEELVNSFGLASKDEVDYLLGNKNTVVTKFDYSGDKRQYTTNRKAYDYYKREIRNTEMVVGNRYFKLAYLATFGIKCGISIEEVKRDLSDLYNYILEKTELESFDKEEVITSALKHYHPDYKYVSARIIKERTGVKFNENKRNGRTRAEHLEYARLCWNGNRKKETHKREYKTRLNSIAKKEKMIKIDSLHYQYGATKRELIDIYGYSKQLVYKVLGPEIHKEPSLSERVKREIIKKVQIGEDLLQKDIVKKLGVSRQSISKVWKECLEFYNKFHKKEHSKKINDRIYNNTKEIYEILIHTLAFYMGRSGKYTSDSRLIDRLKIKLNGSSLNDFISKLTFEKEILKDRYRLLISNNRVDVNLAINF